MIKKGIAMLLVMSLTLTVLGCAKQVHRVGKGAGATSSDSAASLVGTESTRNWYVLWGLVPINDVDSAKMAGDKADYTITTKYTVIDWLINGILGIVTVHARSVEVAK